MKALRRPGEEGEAVECEGQAEEAEAVECEGLAKKEKQRSEKAVRRPGRRRHREGPKKKEKQMSAKARRRRRRQREGQPEQKTKALRSPTHWIRHLLQGGAGEHPRRLPPRDQLPWGRLLRRGAPGRTQASARGITRSVSTRRRSSSQRGSPASRRRRPDSRSREE